jgi:hypothetical protein
VRKLLVVLAFVSFGLAQAQTPTGTVPQDAGHSTGVTAGDASNEQKKAMKEGLQDERNAVQDACVEEAKAANCGDKIVGKGLLKCIHEHKKASKEFKISDSCKTAMRTLKDERRKVKEKK